MEGIAIEVNGGWLDLAANTSIAWEWQSQLFEMNMGGNAEFGLPFEAPMTGNNIRLLNFENIIGLPEINPMPYDAKLYVEGHPLIVAKLYVNVVKASMAHNEGGFSIVLTGWKSQFVGLMADLSLKQLDLGQSNTSPGKDNKVYPTMSFLDNPSSGDYPLAAGLVNIWVNGGVMEDVNSGTKKVKVPCWYMLYVLQQLFVQSGSDLQSSLSNIFSNVQLMKLIVVCNFAETALSFNTPTTLSGPVSSFLPDVSVADFLAALKINFGIHFSFLPNNTVEAVLMKDLIAKPSVDWTNKVQPKFEKTPVQQSYGVFTFEFKPSDQDSNISNPKNVYGFTSNALYKAMLPPLPMGEVEDESQITLPSTNNSWFVKNKNCFWVNNLNASISYYGNALMHRIIGTDSANWLNGIGLPNNSLGSDDDYYLNIATEDIWLKKNGSWGSLVNKKNNFVANSPSDVPTMGVFTISDVWLYTTSTYNIHVPTMGVEYEREEQGDTGIPFSILAGLSNPSLRFLLWHGLQNPWGYANLQYGYASTNNYLPNNIGTKLSDFNLSWYGSEGLYATFWKSFEKTLTNYTEVKMLIQLTILDIINLDLTAPVFIKNNKYFIKTIKQNFPLKSAAEVVLILIQ